MRESVEFLLPPIFCITYIIANRYYPDGPVNIHIQQLINIIQDNNRVITTKKRKGKLPLFCGNVERVMTIYSGICSNKRVESASSNTHPIKDVRTGKRRKRYVDFSKSASETLYDPWRWTFF